MGRWKAGCAVALVVGCGESSTPPPATPPPWDDDAPRLGHCVFEPAPARAPRAAPAPAPIRAGYGSAFLDLPIGAPLSAYGDRVVALGMSHAPDERAARWATGMTVSVGTHDAPRAEALALAAGDEPPLVIMRVDAGFITEGVLFALEEALSPGGELRGRVLLSASHSHAAYGAWLPTVHLVPGSDAPRRELLERAVGSMKAAAEQALAALEPARIGVAVDDDFDPEDRVNRDRREENDAVVGPDGNHAGAGKDRVVWAMRVDRASGEPLVALVDLPVHGTIGEGANPLASSDAIGGVARGIEAALGYPVMHLQGVTGDLSPAGDGTRGACPDPTRCLDMPRMELLGARAAAAVAPLVSAITTDADAAFEIVTRTFPVGRGGLVARPDGRELYYLPPDPDAVPDYQLFAADGFAASPFDEFNTIGGGGLCGGDTPSFAPLPASIGLPPPYNSCIDLDTGVELVLTIFGLPKPTLPECGSVRSTGAALRIAGLSSGDWLVIGVPGEPTAPYAHYLRGRSPAGPERTLIIGYADEYSGYMLTAEDWLSAGYECSTNIWGPREGEQVLESLIAAAAIAWTPEIEDPEAGTDRFVDTPLSDATPEPVVTSDHGTPAPDDAALWWPDTADAVATQPAAEVARAVGLARFGWYGGDPAVDQPEVVVEREGAPGVFAPISDALGRPASSRHGVVIITYTPDPLDAVAPAHHLYAASWQPTAAAPYGSDAVAPWALPLGRYRLKVSGRARAAGGVESYELASPPFDVIAAPLASASTATRGASALSVTALLGPAPGLRALREGPSDGLVALLGPWAVTVTFDDATTATATATPDEMGHAEVALAPADVLRAVRVELRDPAGNGGSLDL
jgi:neutral ceramidase